MRCRKSARFSHNQRKNKISTVTFTEKVGKEQSNALYVVVITLLIKQSKPNELSIMLFSNHTYFCSQQLRYWNSTVYTMNILF